MTFLDKEVYTDFPVGARRKLDVVAKVWTREGTVERVLMNYEFQEEDDLVSATPPDPRALEWLIREKRPLPLPLRMMLYTATLQLRHFPTPVLPVCTWFTGGKGGIGSERYDYALLGAGLGVTFYRVCVPDLCAEEYVEQDNPVAYGLAIRMRRQRMSNVELTLACRRRIVRSDLTPLEKDLLWTFNHTYARLNKDEEAQMQAIVEKPENRDINESNLTWAGKLIKEGELKGELKGKLDAIQKLCQVLHIRITPARRQHLNQLDLTGVEALFEHLLLQHAWPK